VSETIAIVTLIALVFILVVVDVYLAASKDNRTISQVIQSKMTMQNKVVWFVVGWGLGFLCGHLFWPI